MASVQPWKYYMSMVRPIDINSARKEINRKGPTIFAINTDRHLKLELPPIISRSGITQGVFFLIGTIVTIFFNYFIVMTVIYVHWYF